MSMVESMIKPELLSHGTIECSDIAATRQLPDRVPGIDVVRPLPEAQYLWKGGPWSVVCVCVEDAEAKEQGPQNRFKLSVSSPAEVESAHAAARLAQGDAYGIRASSRSRRPAGIRSFKLQDLPTSTGGRSPPRRSATTTRFSPKATPSTALMIERSSAALTLADAMAAIAAAGLPLRGPS